MGFRIAIAVAFALLGLACLLLSREMGNRRPWYVAAASMFVIAVAFVAIPAPGAAQMALS